MDETMGTNSHTDSISCPFCMGRRCTKENLFLCDLYKSFMKGSLSVNQGMMAENLVAQALSASDLPLRFYEKTVSYENGTRMIEELFQAARARDGVRQIELDFVEGNSRARGLYEKMGFRITGVKPDAIRMRDGTFVNEYMMIKRL